MPRLITVLLISVIFAGCDGTFRSRPFQSAACNARVEGYTATYVAYGDSKLVVIPLSKIHENTEWRFILRPLDIGNARSGIDFKNLMVTIKGKRSPGPDDWIDVSGTYNGSAADKHTLVECVKPPVGLTGTEYTYLVTVEEVGKLDPRGRISR